MIVVDSSVWVEFFRDASSPVRAPLAALLDDDAVLLPRSVMVELLAGAGPQQVALLRRLLGALHLLTPSPDTWALVESFATKGAARGHHFGVGDLLVAACAAERGAPVWTLDADFDRMAQLKWIRRHRPR